MGILNKIPMTYIRFHLEGGSETIGSLKMKGMFKKFKGKLLTN
jgi:hypothetical protein